MTGRISRGWYWAAVLIGAVFLIQYWMEFLVNFESGNVVAYQNFWGADVGIYVLLPVLLIITPMFLYFAWKYFPRSLNKVTRDDL